MAITHCQLSAPGDAVLNGRRHNKPNTTLHPGDKSMKADPEGSLEYFSSGATEESEEDPLQAGPKVLTAKDAKHFKVCE